MKILMVSPSYYPNIGGIEKHVQEVSERLVKKHHEVIVLCVDSTLKNIKEEKINGVNVIRCPGFAPKGNYHVSKVLYNKIKELDYDIMHCHGYNSATTPLAILANNKECIVTFHSGGMGLWINNFLHLPYIMLMFFIKHNINKFICVSNFEKRRFSRKLCIKEDKIMVIENGLDFNEFKNLNRIKSDKNLIISVGRLSKYKGFQHVIRGFAEAYKENKSLRLEILGKGDYEDNLKKLVRKLNLEKAVKIVYLERKEMLKHLARSNTFILLSKYESQGIVVLEAMALNKKIILNNRTALKEFVDNGYALGISNIKKYTEIKNKIFQKIKLKKHKIKSWNDIIKENDNLYRGSLNEQ